MNAPKIAFLDRDGTLIHEPADEQVDSLEKLSLVEGVIPALLRLKDAGYEFVMVSNQDGRGTGSFPEEDFRIPQDFMLQLLASQGIRFREIFICPHHPEDGCDCRKPRIGLLREFLSNTPINRSASVVIGDRDSDIDLAANIGLRGLRIDPEDPQAWSAIAHELVDLPRRASIQRETNETTISCTVDLDAEQPISLSTGLPFFDHMLDQLARHGGFSLQLTCEGDLEIDEHHSVEDTALVIGQALRQALGDKRGIARYGFVLPMDEARAQVTLDLSGRAAFRFEGSFPRDSVGNLSTEMVRHFFHSLSDSLAAAIHLGISGENTHHMVEACFKAVGRALRQALKREGSSMPSTKGVL